MQAPAIARSSPGNDMGLISRNLLINKLNSKGRSELDQYYNAR